MAETDGFVLQDNQRGTGNQHFHMRLRYLDPDINAFVGMQMDLEHFNRDLVIGNPDDPATGSFLFDMGAHIGVVQKSHTWDLSLMGVTAAGKLGPCVAITGEHSLSKRWIFYHKTQGDIFVGDAIFDQDQGFYWMVGNTWGVSAGYRWFASLHQDRSGPHVGIRFYFENPKIPFIFPSLG
jgi:hypothetical protein